MNTEIIERWLSYRFRQENCWRKSSQSDINTELAGRYVSRLQDTHPSFNVPANIETLKRGLLWINPGQFEINRRAETYELLSYSDDEEEMPVFGRGRNHPWGGLNDDLCIVFWETCKRFRLHEEYSSFYLAEIRVFQEEGIEIVIVPIARNPMQVDWEFGRYYGYGDGDGSGGEPPPIPPAAMIGAAPAFIIGLGVGGGCPPGMITVHLDEGVYVQVCANGMKVTRRTLCVDPNNLSQLLDELGKWNSPKRIQKLAREIWETLLRSGLTPFPELLPWRSQYRPEQEMQLAIKALEGRAELAALVQERGDGWDYYKQTRHQDALGSSGEKSVLALAQHVSSLANQPDLGYEDRTRWQDVAGKLIEFSYRWIGKRATELCQMPEVYECLIVDILQKAQRPLTRTEIFAEIAKKAPFLPYDTVKSGTQPFWQKYAGQALRNSYLFEAVDGGLWRLAKQ